MEIKRKIIEGTEKENDLSGNSEDRKNMMHQFRNSLDE